MRRAAAGVSAPTHGAGAQLLLLLGVFAADSPGARVSVTDHVGITFRKFGEKGTQVVQERRKSASPAFAPWMNAVISPGV